MSTCLYNLHMYDHLGSCTIFIYERGFSNDMLGLASYSQTQTVC